MGAIESASESTRHYHARTSDFPFHLAMFVAAIVSWKCLLAFNYPSLKLHVAIHPLFSSRAFKAGMRKEVELEEENKASE